MEKISKDMNIYLKLERRVKQFIPKKSVEIYEDNMYTTVHWLSTNRSAMIDPFSERAKSLNKNYPKATKFERLQEKFTLIDKVSH